MLNVKLILVTGAAVNQNEIIVSRCGFRAIFHRAENYLVQHEQIERTPRPREEINGQYNLQVYWTTTTSSS